MGAILFTLLRVSSVLSAALMLNSPLNPDDEDQLRLSRHVEGALLLAKPVQANLLALSFAVLFDLCLSALEDDLALSLGRLH